MTVETYREEDLADMQESASDVGTWCVPEPWLKCGQANCEGDLPLFVQEESLPGGKIRRSSLRGLKWGRVQCSERHGIAISPW